MTTTHTDPRSDSTDPTTINPAEQGKQSKPAHPCSGIILTNDDSVDLDDARVGTCVQFPSGRVAAEIEDPFARELTAATHHYHWRSTLRAREALTDVVGADADVWIEWLG